MNAKCTNMDAAYTCECLPGYNGDGYSCSNKCPSDCWQFNETTQTCDAKKECYDLTCTWNTMKLVFLSDLFDLVENQKPNPFGDKIDPFFNELTDKWELDCQLGECGMDVSTREINSESELVFSYNLQPGIAGMKIGGKHIFIRSFRTSMQIECVYKTEVKVSSSAFNVAAADASARVLEFNSLQAGFSINIFTDQQMSEPIDTQSQIFVGQTIYASVDWAVSSLTDSVNFYINSCEVQFGDSKTLPIIDDNCYSAAFSTVQLQSNKIVSQKARFKFTSFTFRHGARSMKINLRCSIKTCSVEENLCNDHISETDFDCPNVVALAYKANSYLKN